MRLEDIKTEKQARKALEERTKMAVESINKDRGEKIYDAIETYEGSLKFIFGVAKKFHINVEEYVKQIFRALPVMY